MQYTIEELSACKKKVNVSVPAEEVNAAISTAVALQKDGIALDGFRKGHVPSAVIEKRFKAQLYRDASQDLLNVHIQTITSELNVTPVSGLNFDGNTEIERDKPMEYSIVFEHLPIFDLPDYEGIEVQQKETKVTDEAIDGFITRIREDRAKYVPLDGDVPAKDGEYVNLDLEVYVDGVKENSVGAQGADMLVGQKSVLPELDSLVKTLVAGASGESEVDFPADFFAPALAGKHGVLKVTVHAIKERQLPEVNDEFVAKMNCQTVEEFRSRVEETIKAQTEQLFKAGAQKNLIDYLIKQVDFEVPEAMVETFLGNEISEHIARAERMGKAIAPEKLEEIKEQLKPQAIEKAKSTCLLMAIARKEGLDVTEDEVTRSLYHYAQTNGIDPTRLVETVQRTGEIFSIRDSMLADKGMNAVYAKAKVTMVPAEEMDAEAKDAAAE